MSEVHFKAPDENQVRMMVAKAEIEQRKAVAQLMAGAFRWIANALRTVMVAAEAAREMESLYNMSNAELRALGLSRQDIPSHVVALMGEGGKRLQSNGNGPTADHANRNARVASGETRVAA